MSKRRKLGGVDEKFDSIMKDIMFERALKGLAKKNIRELSLREATFLLRTTPSFPRVVQELKTLPKRKRK